MKTKTLALKGLLFTGIILFTASSCQKRKDNRSTVSTEDMSIAEAGFGDLRTVIENAAKEEEMEGNRGSSIILGSCATLTMTPAWPDSTFPKTLTVDFGSTNCADGYGNKRRGVVTAVFTGFYRDASTQITITPQNYYVNDYKVEGTKIVTNNGKNSSGNSSFNVEVKNGKITSPTGDVTTWESTQTREWVVGENTTFLTDGIPGILDDEYDITGTASGTNRAGKKYTVTVTSPLRAAVACRWIKKGKLEVQPEGLRLREVNFGDGNCDNKATVTISGKVYNIIMR